VCVPQFDVEYDFHNVSNSFLIFAIFRRQFTSLLTVFIKVVILIVLASVFCSK